jgi:hypothetical protein
MIAGCSTPQGTTALEKRASILKMQDQTLPAFTMRNPDLERAIANSYGYAVVSRDDLTLFWIGGGGGYGVATVKATGEQRFLKDAHGSLNLGGGWRDCRGLYIFSDQAAFEGFCAGSWDFGIRAEVAVASRDRGFEQSAEETALPRVRYYEYTDSGLVLRIGLPLCRVWPWSELDNATPTRAPTK